MNHLEENNTWHNCHVVFCFVCLFKDKVLLCLPRLSRNSQSPCPAISWYCRHKASCPPELTSFFISPLLSFYVFCLFTILLQIFIGQLLKKINKWRLFVLTKNKIFLLNCDRDSNNNLKTLKWFQNSRKSYI